MIWENRNHEVSPVVNRRIHANGEWIACSVPCEGEYPLPENYNPVTQARYAPQPAYCHVEQWEYEEMLKAAGEPDLV